MDTIDIEIPGAYPTRYEPSTGLIYTWFANGKLSDPRQPSEVEQREISRLMGKFARYATPRRQKATRL